MSTALATVLADLLTIEQQNVVGNYLQNISQVLISINAQEELLEKATPIPSSIENELVELKKRIKQLEEDLETKK